MEYSFRHRLHSFQQPCPCQREIDRGTERNTDRYHTEYRTQSLVYPMARLQDCRCGMGYGHRLYGSNAYYVILLTGKDSHLTISIACFNMRKETVGPSQAVIRLSCFAGLGMGVILTLICGVFSEELISCVIDSEGIREYGTPLVRTLLLSGPVMGILFIYINTLQAIGAAGYSFLLSISRQGLIFIPCLLLFDRLFRLYGAVAAQPVADILSLLLAVWLFWRTEKRMGKAPSFV